MGSRARLLTLILICTLTACGSAPAEPDSSELTIAAASSLAPVFQEMEAEFRAESGIRVVFSFSSTGHLAQQIRNGAPYDLFAAADQRHVDMLIASGELLEASRTPFAEGVLVLVTRRGAGIGTLNDATRQTGLRMVIANPAHAPYGIAARQVLERTGRWEDLRDDIAYAETVRQATQVVETGNADIGLVALSTTQSSDLTIIPIDAALYDPILHVAAVLASSEHAMEANTFLEFLTSEPGADALQFHGLEPRYGP